MRTRKEIEQAIKISNTGEPIEIISRRLGGIMELLLDIRDLLKNPPVEIDCIETPKEKEN